jgi:hypothetical protein
MNIYCKNCKYDRFPRAYGMGGGCYHTECFTNVCNFYGAYKQRNKDGSELNKNNDCKYYKKKWWKFWAK